MSFQWDFLRDPVVDLISNFFYLIFGYYCVHIVTELEPPTNRVDFHTLAGGFIGFVGVPGPWLDNIFSILERARD